MANGDDRERLLLLAKAKLKLRQQQAAAAPQQEPQSDSILSQLGRAGLRTLDVAGAPIRTAISGGIEAAQQGNILPEDISGIPGRVAEAAKKQFVDPITGRGEAPSVADIRGQLGVKDESLSVPLPVDVPGIGPSLELAPTVDVLGGAAVDPTSFIAGGPVKAGLQKTGEKIFVGSLKNIDKQVKSASRGAGSFSKLAREEGLTGNNQELLEQTQDLIKRLGQQRDELFDVADQFDISIDVKEALKPVRSEISKLRKSSLPKNQSKAKQFQDIVDRIEAPANQQISQGSFTVPARPGVEPGKFVSTGEFIVPSREAIEGGRRVGAGSFTVPAREGRAAVAPGQFVEAGSFTVPARSGSGPQSEAILQGQARAFGGPGVPPQTPGVPATQVPVGRIEGPTQINPATGLAEPGPGQAAIPGVPATQVPLTKIEGPATINPVTGELSPAAGRPAIPSTSVPVSRLEGPTQIDPATGLLRPAPGRPAVPATTVEISKNPAFKLNPKTVQFERVKNKFSIDEATRAKSEFAESLPDSSFGQFGKLKTADKKLTKKLQEGFKNEIIRSANKKAPGLGQNIDQINRKFQTAFNALKPLEKAAKAEARRNITRPVDLLTNTLLGTGVRTRVGQALGSGGPPGLDTVLRRGVIESNE